MKRLVVCCDGTWNTADQEENGVPTPTNVVRLRNALAESDEEGNEQRVYYHPGVGTEGNLWQKFTGGAAGAGLGRNVVSAYRWLCGEYEEGDLVYLFGFSRGAYTVRSVGGLICKVGLLGLQRLSDDALWRRVHTAYDKGYRDGKVKVTWGADWPLHHGAGANGAVTIHFLGVWDTVGATGIPDDMALLNLFDPTHKYRFHDTQLGGNVVHARQALAMDEKRASFTPTLWTDVAPQRDVKQVWFPGAHSDVGGGYLQTGLSDGALKWMIDEATVQGLRFEDSMVAQIRPNHLDVLHNSWSGAFALLPSQPRGIPYFDCDAEKPPADLHPSAFDRFRTPPITQAPYRKSLCLEPDDEVTVTIYARDPWNETGIYLVEGARYQFTATGQWKDGDTIACGPEGAKDGKFQLGEAVHAVMSGVGQVEKVWGVLSGNELANFAGTRRHENIAWFALIGGIAHNLNPKKDGTPMPMKAFRIGRKSTRSAPYAGYLYCYANDAWNFYGNNAGSVRLTVRRLRPPS